MIRHTALNTALGHVIEVTANKVMPWGFIRRGSVLRALRQGNSGIVEFQKSTKSSGDRLLFTVNLAVICGELLGPDQPSLAKARTVDAHFRQRIGMLLPDRPDKWWEVTDVTDVHALATEVSDLIVREAVPYLLPYLDTNGLISLWISGKSPGLTETQRMRYLEEFNKKSRE